MSTHHSVPVRSSQSGHSPSSSRPRTTQSTLSAIGSKYHAVIADLPGVRFWYEDTGGTGVPVVLAHAGTGSASMWIHQVPAFARAGYRVLAYDRRGHGRTAEQGQANAAEDLHRLMDHL